MTAGDLRWKEMSFEGLESVVGWTTDLTEVAASIKRRVSLKVERRRGHSSWNRVVSKTTSSIPVSVVFLDMSFSASDRIWLKREGDERM